MLTGKNTVLDFVRPIQNLPLPTGMGYADLENRVPCSPDTVMRIASISKPLTAAAAARLWEEGKLDLDAPVQKYVPEFPEKTFQGEAVSSGNTY